MDLSEKIQKLRKNNKWTQEQLAQKLFVSRTAVAKWESGRGYPSIDSLKDLAKLFDKTVDELLAGEEIIEIAKKENINNVKKASNLIYVLLDIISVLFVFLPIYAYKTESFVYSVALFNANNVSGIMKGVYTSSLLILSLIGTAELIVFFLKDKKAQILVKEMSVIFQVLLVLLFAITRQAYLTVIIFVLLTVKLVAASDNRLF